MSDRIVITGVCNGIGEKLALSLLDYGYEVIGIDCMEKNSNKSIHYFKCDVTNSDSVERTFKNIQKEYGVITGLVNIVGGTLHSKNIEDINDQDWEETINFNLKTPFNCIRSALPMLKKSNRGRIINISAVAGRTYTFFGGVDFTAAKTGIIGLTRQCAFELAKYNITANCVAPGLTMTNRVVDLWEGYTEKKRKNILKQIPLNRPSSVDEQVNVIKFLCSEESSYITGTVIDVNGGMFVG